MARLAQGVSEEGDDAPPEGTELQKTDDSPIVLALAPGAAAAATEGGSGAGTSAGAGGAAGGAGLPPRAPGLSRFGAARAGAKVAAAAGRGAFGDDDEEEDGQPGERLLFGSC